jgi:hypothetical protein
VAVAHDDHAVGPVRGDGQVVRDDQHDEALRTDQAAEVVEDPFLDGHVERWPRTPG